MLAREGSGVAARRFDEAAVLTPLILSPIYRNYLWGGRRFETALGRKLPGDDVYAESWQLVDRGTDQSVVAAGPLAGATLGSLVSTRGRELLGRHSPQRAFPLLFKFLDACQDLSVQVHPDDRRAATTRRRRPPPAVSDRGRSQSGGRPRDRCGRWGTGSGV